MKRIFILFSPEEGTGGGATDNSQNLQQGGAGNAEASGSNENVSNTKGSDAGPSSTEGQGESEDTNADGIKEAGSKNSATEGAENLSASDNHGLTPEGQTTIEASAKSEPDVRQEAARKGLAVTLNQAHSGLLSTLKSFVQDEDFSDNESVKDAYNVLKEGQEKFTGPVTKEGLGQGIAAPVGSPTTFDRHTTPRQKLFGVISMIDEYIGQADNTNSESASEQLGVLKSAREHLVKATL